MRSIRRRRMKPERGGETGSRERRSKVRSIKKIRKRTKKKRRRQRNMRMRKKKEGEGKEAK